MAVARCEFQRSSTAIYSNEVRFYIKPTSRGNEEEAWARINREDFLRFLQWERWHREEVHERVIRLGVQVLRELPGSGYDAAIRSALLRYYAYQVQRIREYPPFPASQKTREELQKTLAEVRAVLDLPRRAIYDVEREVFHTVPAGAGERLFPEDRRLDREITFSAPEFTPLRSLLILPYPVPQGFLRLSPELAGSYEAVQPAGEIRESLREFMRHTMPPGTKWVKDADGYQLVPAPKEKRNK
jgi:hypothetical protein